VGLQPVDRGDVGEAGERDARDRLVGEPVPGGAVGLVAGPHFAGAGGVLESAREVDHAAHHRVLADAPGADGAGDHHAGRHPGAAAQVDAAVAADALDRLQARLRGHDRSVGVVGMGVGRAEHGDQAVAAEGVDVAVEVLDDGRHAR
jgi:hypothetical protein